MQSSWKGQAGKKGKRRKKKGKTGAKRAKATWSRESAVLVALAHTKHSRTRDLAVSLTRTQYTASSQPLSLFLEISLSFSRFLLPLDRCKQHRCQSTYLCRDPLYLSRVVALSRSLGIYLPFASSSLGREKTQQHHYTHTVLLLLRVFPRATLLLGFKDCIASSTKEYEEYTRHFTFRNVK